MRIVHAIPSIDHARGGPPVVVTRLAAAQGSLGHDVHILTYDSPGRQPAIDAELSAVPGMSRVTIHSLPANRLEKLLTVRACRWLNDANPAPDVLHLHHVWEPMLKHLASIARRRGIPYAVVPHGMLDPWSLSQSPWKKRLALAIGYRRMLDRAAFIHALNADEAAGLAPLRLRSRAEVIPNGIFLQEIDPLPEPGTFRRRYPSLGNSPFIFFISRLHHKKGLDVLGEAFILLAPRLPDVHLVVGGGDRGAQGPFEAQIAGAGLTARVHVVGPLFGPDKFAAFRDAACFCLPSRSEGFSIAATEALACGLPVVLSEACHFPEVAEAGAGEIVPLNAQAVADALWRVLSDPVAARAKGYAGRQLVVSRYTWEKVAVRSIEAYRRAVEVASGAASGAVAQTGTRADARASS